MEIADQQNSGFSNLTRKEKQALENLKNDKSIIIKSADKGSSVVVWDREDYLKEAEDQLSDDSVYEEVVGDPSPNLALLITDALAKIKDLGVLDQDTLNFLEPDDPKLGRFYLLPKIHKRFFRVPGRPIISNSGYYTENISAFLDHHLQPVAQKVKSYIKDTNDFLKKIRDLGNIPENLILCSIDVVGLYPNIPHEEGLEAMRNRLNMRENQSVPTEALVDLASLVLKNNFFEHNGKIFHQKQGTAMGTKFAPPYAISFMADFEEKAMADFDLKPFVWWRYIDDVFMIWEHGEEELKRFINYLNSIHPTMKFTHSFSTESIDFLDVHVSKIGSVLKTDLFVKETDTHQYLHYKSCHTYHTKKGIPYGQALRLRRIISDDTQLGLQCDKLVGWLTNRGFPERMVKEQVERAKCQDRDTYS